MVADIIVVGIIRVIVDDDLIAFVFRTALQ